MFERTVIESRGCLDINVCGINTPLLFVEYLLGFCGLSPGLHVNELQSPTLNKAMFTLYRIGFAPARKPYRIGLLRFTPKSGDFGVISVTTGGCPVAILPCEASHIG